MDQAYVQRKLTRTIEDRPALRKPSTSMAIAQGTTSRISGTVTDTSGANVPNATITAPNGHV
jgi:hypothetical protein